MQQNKMQHKKIFFNIFLSICLAIWLDLLRNEWYAFFYQAIEKKSSIAFYCLSFLLIHCFIFIVNFLKDYLKIKFIEEGRKKYANLTSNNAKIDYSQRISEDIRLQAENFINFIDNLIYGSLLISVFVIRLFNILEIKDTFLLLLILGIYVFILFLFNFGYFNKILKINLYKFEEYEARLRKYLSTCFSPKIIKPILFDFKFFEAANLQMKRYFLLKNLFDKIKELISSFGLLLPFLFFYPLFVKSKINFGLLMQLINLWMNVHFGAIKLFNAMEYYFTSDVSMRRFIKFYKTKEVEEIFSNDITMKNLSIMNGSKQIIENFELSVLEGEKYNIVGENGVGKSTIFFALKGLKNFKGKITTPQNTIFIPENPILNNLNKSNLKENLKLLDFELDEKRSFEKISNGEKWKIIAAQAMLFECVIWDDPFWGVDAENYIEKILPKLKTVLIFSQKPIKNFKHVYLK